MTRQDIEAVIKDAVEGESFYWQIFDGHCAGTEFVWLPSAKRWIYRDNDSGTVSDLSELILVISSENGDDSGMNSVNELVTVELSGGPGLWVLNDKLDSYPDDAQVFTLGDPTKDLVELDLENAE